MNRSACGADRLKEYAAAVSVRKSRACSAVIFPVTISCIILRAKKIRGFHVAARDHFALRPFDDEATVELCQLTGFLERNLIIDPALENV
ncbi:MAG: hypothetical protein M3505_08925 [Verrucomicrobiota bacterium]|nr:hypothetical protein [Verrucomicrobiota bacterium]